MRRRRHETIEDHAPLDPVGLTLAIWLGGIVAVTGLVRYSNEAANGLAAERAAAAVTVASNAGPAWPRP